MKKRPADIVFRQIYNTLVSIMQYVIIVFAVTVFIAVSLTTLFFLWYQISRTYLPTASTISSLTKTNSNSSSSNPQDAQILSEAQQDVTISNNIITWSGFFLAFIASTVTIAGFLGIREFRHIRHLSSDFDKYIEEVRRLKAQAESESPMLIEASYNFGLAANAYKVGDNVSAIENYLRVLGLQPNNKHVMERLGRAYSNLNDMKNAVYYLENKALAIDPSYFPALRSLGLCYRYTNRDKAIDYLQQALKINPSDYESWDFLGLIYRDNKLIDEAISAHEQALDLKKRPETQFYLSILYYIKGNKKRAKIMAHSAEDDLHKIEHDLRVRPVWKDLIRAGFHIVENNDDEAYKLVVTLTTYITTQRICDAVTGHLKFLLEATDHKDWIPRFTNIVKVKEKQDAAV